MVARGLQGDLPGRNWALAPGRNLAKAVRHSKGRPGCSARSPRGVQKRKGSSNKGEALPDHSLHNATPNQKNEAYYYVLRRPGYRPPCIVEGVRGELSVVRSHQNFQALLIVRNVPLQCFPRRPPTALRLLHLTPRIWGGLAEVQFARALQAPPNPSPTALILPPVTPYVLRSSQSESVHVLN